jgi:nicotinamide riboside kinase
LCDIDLPWQNDGMREHPKNRQELLAIYEKELKELNKSYSLVSGNNRTQLAIDLVKRYA